MALGLKFLRCPPTGAQPAGTSTSRRTGLQCTGRRHRPPGVDHPRSRKTSPSNPAARLATTTTKRKASSKGITSCSPTHFSGQFQRQTAKRSLRHLSRGHRIRRPPLANARPTVSRGRRENVTPSPRQTTAPPPPGSYTGAIPGQMARGLKFFVSGRQRRHLQGPSTSRRRGLQCTGEGNPATGVDHLEAAGRHPRIRHFRHIVREGDDRERQARRSPGGVHVHVQRALPTRSTGSESRAGAAGMYSRGTSPTKASTRRCTTNNQILLRHALTPQPTQTTGAPPPPRQLQPERFPGNGTGLKVLRVPPDSAHLQDVLHPGRTGLQWHRRRKPAPASTTSKAQTSPSKAGTFRHKSFAERANGPREGRASKSPGGVQRFTFSAGHFPLAPTAAKSRGPAGFYHSRGTSPTKARRAGATTNKPILLPPRVDSQPTQTNGPPPPPGKLHRSDPGPNGTGLKFFRPRGTVHTFKERLTSRRRVLQCTGEGKPCTGVETTIRSRRKVTIKVVTSGRWCSRKKATEKGISRRPTRWCSRFHLQRALHPMRF